MRISLPSRASSPENCRECDGPADEYGYCSECVGASLLQRLEWRYQNGEGISSIWEGDRWSVSREFHPLEFRLLVELSIGWQSFSGAIALGLWTFAIARNG